MKKILLLALMTLMGTGAFAQTSKGTLVLAGGLSLNAIKNEETYNNGTQSNNYSLSNKTFRFSISPTIGYFIADNLEWGISTAYGFERNKPENSNVSAIFSSSTKEQSLSIGTYLQKYFMLSDKIAVHGKANLYYASTKRDFTSVFYSEPEQQQTHTNTLTNNEAGLAISPGLTFFPSTKIGLGASFGKLGYTYYSYHNKNDGSTSESSSNALGVNLSSNSLVFSFSYYISR